MSFAEEGDPLLKQGAYIDPNPSSNGDSVPPPDHNKSGSDPPAGLAAGETVGVRPDWLPPGWELIERVRSSGASAGTRDKYYMDPVTHRRFRSKKEVLHYLETGGFPKSGSAKRKSANGDGDSMPPADSQTPNKKKSVKTTKDLVKQFNFDDVPAKVKWELTDVYELTWRPLINSVDRVPENAKQEWAAAFSYLTVQNGGGLL